MNNGIFKIDEFFNERVLSYLPGCEERDELRVKLREAQSTVLDIPVVIGGVEYRTNKTRQCIVPHNKNKVIGQYHEATEELVHLAIETALKAKAKWAATPWEHRAAIFKRAAYLASTSWRQKLNAAIMLDKSKTFYQAEIDSACELCDFFNIAVYQLSKIYDTSSTVQVPDSMNRLEYRPLEGFVFAVTPFNFAAIEANLPGAPALAGNVVVWKPASSTVYSAYTVYKLLEEAGLPGGVINFIPGNAGIIGDIVLNHPELNAVNFTGSTEVFKHMWKTVGLNIDKYRNYPRLVGETGGKNFVLAHNTANVNALTASMIRGAFEFQGQKCSATSRVYLPASLWSEIRELLVSETKTITMGNTEDFNNFIGAVIDKKSFDNIKSYIDFARNAKDAEIICGGTCDDSIGYFVEPTIILTTNLKFKTMVEEIFGPVLTVYVYEDEDYDYILHYAADASEYGLTGSIFASDRYILKEAEDVFMYSAGNFYINDKTTGAVVGQSPFGGSRASGTNDKVGTMGNILKWLNPRSIKENFVFLQDYRYEFMSEEENN